MIAVEATLGDDETGAYLVRALCEPTQPGEFMCVVPLKLAATVAPVTPASSSGDSA